MNEKRLINWIKQLIKLVEDSDIESLEVCPLTKRVRIRKSVGVRTIAATHAAPVTFHTQGPELAAPNAGTGLVVTGNPDAFEVTSPMVGTFFRAAAPDASPFVSVGDHVEKGQTLCILEAMKLMNELVSEVSGVITEIMVENAEPVEFGALLFRIDLI
jgi:acetyl-CoA carboxylase biotin carboxyl carrier protein